MEESQNTFTIPRQLSKYVINKFLKKDNSKGILGKINKKLLASLADFALTRWEWGGEIGWVGSFG